jgi:hypothetical protein
VHRPKADRALLAGLLLVLAPFIAPLAAADELKPFEASYAWIWNGMNVAVSTLKLEKTGDTWTYTSKSEPRGIGKLMSERPKTVSVFKVTPDGVQPLSYKGDDGTSSSKHTIDVKYDWSTHRVTGVYEDTPVDLPLTPDLQDDASQQIAMMVLLLRGKTPEHFANLDKNTVREYRYKRDGEETLTTPFGKVPTVIFSSSKANSPRTNRYWCAPDRGFIPIRVQQTRGSDVEWTMEIESLKRE